MGNKELEFEYDFCGWATRNGLKCADGRTIVRDAFKHNDGDIVPLVWNHGHNDPNNVLGNALLENRDEGVYVYGSFNNTPAANNAREFIKHGDIKSLSIYASKLKQDDAKNVMHGDIKEVSLVLAGANPGAYIEDVIVHGDTDGGSIIYSEDYIESEELEHAEDTKELKNAEENQNGSKDNGGDETVEDVFNTLTDKQKNVVYYMIGQALENENNNEEDKGDDENMKHNLSESYLKSLTEQQRIDEMKEWSASEVQQYLCPNGTMTLEEFRQKLYNKVDEMILKKYGSDYIE